MTDSDGTADTANTQNTETTATASPLEEVPERNTVLASAAIGAIMLVAAVLVIVDALRLPETSEAVGPAAVPLPVGVLVGVVGAVLLIQARPQLSTASRETTWQPRAGLRLLGMIVALVAFAVS